MDLCWSDEKGKTTEETYEGYLSVDYRYFSNLNLTRICWVNTVLLGQSCIVSSRQTNRKFIGRIVNQQLHIN